MITVDCFKYFAMIANTDQGNQVRKYFLIMEKIVKEFYTSTIERRITNQNIKRLMMN